MKQRYVLIAWPEDHEEDLGEHACLIADALAYAQVGAPEVIFPLPDDALRELAKLDEVDHGQA